MLDKMQSIKNQSKNAKVSQRALTVTLSRLVSLWGFYQFIKGLLSVYITRCASPKLYTFYIYVYTLYVYFTCKGASRLQAPVSNYVLGVQDMYQIVAATTQPPTLLASTTFQ